MNPVIRRLAASCLVLAAAPAFADVTSINGVQVQPRRFNDFPDSMLNVVNMYPAMVCFQETFPADGDDDGFANQHLATFSDNNGASAHSFQNDCGFDISMTVRLDVSETSPRKEVGFRFDTLIAGEAFFFVTSDGEVAAFGAFFPFQSTNAGHLGGMPYVPGTDATLRIIYTPGDGQGGSVPATIEYVYNGNSSGPLEIGNTENGFINGTTGGVYAQYQLDDDSDEDFANTCFSNFSVNALPECAADFNNSGAVNSDDYFAFLDAFFKGCK